MSGAGVAAAGVTGLDRRPGGAGSGRGAFPRVPAGGTEGRSGTCPACTVRPSLGAASLGTEREGIGVSALNPSRCSRADKANPGLCAAGALLGTSACPLELRGESGLVALRWKPPWREPRCVARRG